MEELVEQLQQSIKLLNAKKEAVYEDRIEQCQLCGEFGHVASTCYQMEFQYYNEPMNWDQNDPYNYNEPVNWDQNDPYSSAYNPGWSNHSNFGWGDNAPGQYSNYNQQQQYNMPMYHPAQTPFQEDQFQILLEAINAKQGEYDRKFDDLENSLRKLEIQFGQVVSQLTENLRRDGKLPAQPEPTKAVHDLRSGKQVDNQVPSLTSEQVILDNMQDNRKKEETIEESKEKESEESWKIKRGFSGEDQEDEQELQHYQSPMLNEGETVEFIIPNTLPLCSELTTNVFFLVVNVLNSDGKAKRRQWNLKICYKLHLQCLYGEVYMKGANGDGVLWNIKVHPP